MFFATPRGATPADNCVTTIRTTVSCNGEHHPVIIRETIGLVSEDVMIAVGSDPNADPGQRVSLFRRLYTLESSRIEIVRSSANNSAVPDCEKRPEVPVQASQRYSDFAVTENPTGERRKMWLARLRIGTAQTVAYNAWVIGFDTRKYPRCSRRESNAIASAAAEYDRSE